MQSTVQPGNKTEIGKATWKQKGPAHARTEFETASLRKLVITL